MIPGFSFIISIILFASSLIKAQDNSSVPEAQNGYYWNSIERLFPYSNSRLDFLLTKLKEYNIIRSITGTDHLKDCRDELTALQESETAENIEIEFIVKELDKFYKEKNNLTVLVSDAYCYAIKKIAGKDDQELNKYLLLIRIRYKH